MTASLRLRDPLEHPLTILLVEDDYQVRRWLHGELEKLGYNLLEACDGADALVIAELHPGPIDVIVTDVIMPNVNGVALVRRLLPILPDVKVIYISGFPGVLPSGIDYLAKPFKLSDLVNNINNLTRDIGFGTVNLPQQETTREV